MAKKGLYGSDVGENLPRVIVAEFIGTFFLVLAGTAAATAAVLGSAIAGQPANSLAVALSFGLVLAALVSALGHISGAHFNPAVTLGLAATGKFPWKYVLPYICTQLVGAGLASLSVLLIFGSKAYEVAKLGATYPVTGTNSFKVLFVEFLITFLLMLIVVAVATDKRASGSIAGIAVGFGLCAAILIGGPVTGGAVNPARALGPMVVAHDLAYWWVYVTGPIAGAVSAAFLYDKFLAKAEDPSEAEEK